MSDIIQLLPDSVANQIAAGEVVQRPASVVKELLENSIDAGATEIQLIVKDAGRTLIQVIDNGQGMSPTDARMSLERHATSKIKKANDLFHIKTMGFRGEAVASIVAVAQCEIKTKRAEDELATHIVVEGSKVIKQEPATGENGTSVTVKNLFFNIPARRKFLKSNAVENRHLIDQFERIAIIYPHISFTYFQDDTKMFEVKSGVLRQRIVGIFGKKFDTRLVPVQEETSLVKINGFICKPEYAKKKKDGQFLFVNNRYIKSNYLHHGILSAFDELIPSGMHPTYFIHLECDPESIDVNIHPTKTEVKFEEERSIYAIIRSAVKKALGEHNIAPSLDFNRETAFDGIDPKQNIIPPTITVNPGFNPFEKQSSGSSGFSGHSQQKVSVENWEQLVNADPVAVQQDLNFEPIQNEFVIQKEEVQPSNYVQSEKQFFQVQGKYIMTPIKSGIMVIHRRRAQERILYESNLRALAMNQGLSQKSLFPVTIELSASNAATLNSLISELQLLGFDIDEFGKHSFIVRGLPAEVAEENCTDLIDEIIQSFKDNEQNLEMKSHINLAYTLARRESIQRNRILEAEECSSLIDSLFACENPQSTVTGKTIVSTLGMEELDKKFS